MGKIRRRGAHCVCIDLEGVVLSSFWEERANPTTKGGCFFDSWSNVPDDVVIEGFGATEEEAHQSAIRLRQEFLRRK